MLKFTDTPKERVLETLQSSEAGLSEKEAEKRLKEFGRNELKEGKKKTVAGLFFSQLCDVMTILLIAAAFISAVVAWISKDLSDLADTAIIAVIILLNAVVGTVQQYRADKAIAGLKKLNGATAKVRRGGKVTVVDAADVVIGDIVILEEGDVVPADLRIIKSTSLRCVEAALTGEAHSVDKRECVINKPKVDYHDACNLAFSSTFVVGGSGEGVVIATGAATEIGSIATMLQDMKKSESPLEKSLNKLGKIISVFVIAVAAIVFAVGIFARQTPLLKNFMTAVAIAVAAIPEGLPAVVSVIMAMGVQRMSRENVVIRKMKCVETLGGCTRICTDKTGTLTCNQMKVVNVIEACKSNSPQHSMGCFDKIRACMATCNSVKGKAGEYIGDPTEIALKKYALKEGFERNFETTGEIPFSSDRKLMSVRVKICGAEKIYCKGAPEVLIKRCTQIEDNGRVRSVTQADRERFLSECRAMSAEALRVLAFAYKDGGNLSEECLVLLGACGMIDDLKEGVPQAVATCAEAGITTVMITGDSPETALAIAKKAGICADRSQVLTGEELDRMTKPQLKEAALQGRVFARVSPKHKNIIVRILKAEGEVVAMTGDGVNDAPCVKSADIGIVMGKSGTEVTKSVADMVICDDNFTTIVTAVKEGRRISSNIKKTIQFFLSTNLAEVLAILAVTFAFFGCGFLPSTQLLWLNLITDSFPVLALGVERGGDDMKNPPERAEKALFSKSSLAFILASSLYITGVTVGAYAYALAYYGVEAATTVAFITLSFSELFHAFNVRSGNRSAFVGILSNKVLLFTVLLGVGVNVALCLSPLAGAFKIAALPAKLWAVAAGAALSVIPFCEVYKLIIAAIRRAKRRTPVTNARHLRHVKVGKPTVQNVANSAAKN